jgi:alcohol dehydrogenase YqhD (iron-dependent ADH family)
MKVCKELGIELLWNVGGGKIQSSSEMVQNSNMFEPTGEDIQPTRVDIVSSGDLPKKW